MRRPVGSALSYVEVFRVEPIKRIGMIKSGLRAAEAKRILADLAVTQAVAMRALNISATTMNRKVRGEDRLDRDHQPAAPGERRHQGAQAAPVDLRSPTHQAIVRSRPVRPTNPSQERDPRVAVACHIIVETGFRPPSAPVERVWLDGFEQGPGWTGAELERYETAGMVQEHGTAEEAWAALVAGWMEARQGDLLPILRVADAGA